MSQRETTDVHSKVEEEKGLKNIFSWIPVKLRLPQTEEWQEREKLWICYEIGNQAGQAIKTKGDYVVMESAQDTVKWPGMLGKGRAT